jgi:arginyl-tRNA synthetase
MIKKIIIQDLIDCWNDLGFKYNDKYYIETPKNPSYGDFSTNVALVNARINNLSSKEMAEKIAEYLSHKAHYKSVTVAGNGFVNFVVANRVYRKALQSIYNAKENFGKNSHGEGKKVLIEFVSANPTGPLNVVNARAAAYGDTLYRSMNWAGFEAKREFYINDAGNQVDVLAESLEIRYRELLGDTVEELPAGAYQGEYVKDLAVKLKAKEGTKILHYSEPDKLEKMKEFALEEIHEMQMASLERFRVEYDSWVSEKILRTQGVIEEVLSYLAEANCTYESEDAVWFASSKFGDEKDRVLLKSDGEITYFVPDLAYHLTKYHRGFDHMIDVLGPDHHGYVPRLKAAIFALKFPEEKLEIVFLQQVNLFEGGEKVKMSKRTGNMITMDELIDEVGVDAARFFFLEKKPNAHLNFDLELAKKKTNENPVYYCQYAHARICSIQRKAKKDKISLDKFDNKELKRLKHPEEIRIIKKLLEFENTVNSVADTREPHRLAFFCYDLASLFHKYYQKFQIINDKHPELSSARLYLIIAIKNVLAICFDLMGISAPNRMSKKDGLIVDKVKEIKPKTTVQEDLLVKKKKKEDSEKLIQSFQSVKKVDAKDSDRKKTPAPELTEQKKVKKEKKTSPEETEVKNKPAKAPKTKKTAAATPAKEKKPKKKAVSLKETKTDKLKPTKVTTKKTKSVKDKD